jgi:bile acid-coenzyme A ligase
MSSGTQPAEVVAEPGTPLALALGGLAEADPQRPAITHEGRTISRRDLDLRTNHLARAYSELGVTPGSFVTIGLPNGIEFYEAAIATWKLGATPQPISARLPALERRTIIDIADPSLVVGVAPSDSGGRPAVPAGFVPPRHLSSDPLPPQIAPSLKAPTSGGSTGRPKLIVATQPAVLESVLPFANLLHMKPNGVHLATGPLYHNGPFLSSVCALFVGCHVVVMSRFDAERALELIEEFRVDWIYVVPTMMMRIWRLPEEVRLAHDISSLEVLMHMAAPCPAWLKQEWIDWLGPDRVVELYGATEVQALTLISGREWLAHRGSVGRPVIGEVKILDADGAEIGPGEVGEIWMRRGEGAPAPYRYIGAEARGRDGGWETVGDLGWCDADGYLYLADRDSDMILVGGSNVYPAEVEAALDEHPAVLSSCVIGLPDLELGNVPHAVIQTTAEVSDAELVAHMRDRLVGYKVPRSFERTDAPLRDEAGKVRRSALRAERLNEQPSAAAHH